MKIGDANSNAAFIENDGGWDVAVLKRIKQSDLSFNSELAQQLLTDTQWQTLVNLVDGFFRQLPGQSKKELKSYRVTLKENKGDKFTIVFDCQAEDVDHADEQAMNAYPDGEIINTILFPDTFQGVDICSGCGGTFPPSTLEAITEEGFDLVCPACKDKPSTVALPVTVEFLEDVVDALKELADDSEEAGYPHRASNGHSVAEKLREAIVAAMNYQKNT